MLSTTLLAEAAIESCWKMHCLHFVPIMLPHTDGKIGPVHKQHIISDTAKGQMPVPELLQVVETASLFESHPRWMHPRVTHQWGTPPGQTPAQSPCHTVSPETRRPTQRPPATTMVPTVHASFAALLLTWHCQAGWRRLQPLLPPLLPSSCCCQACPRGPALQEATGCQTIPAPQGHRCRSWTLAHC